MRNEKEIKNAMQDSEFNFLGRKIFIENFTNLLRSQESSKHICINGVWGSGKTTTIKGIIDHLENLENTFETDKPLVLYLDSWKYEHYQHPLFALLKVMQNELPEVFDKIKVDFEKRNTKLQFGFNLPGLFNVNMTENKSDPYSRLLSEAEYIDALNESMISAIKWFKEELSNELIIFIDELDRAKPDFALRTIEMFHHLQDELPTHIVYSVDMNQLSSIIKHYYGYEYNVDIFTHKVFDEVIRLQKLTVEEEDDYIQRTVKSLLKSHNVSCDVLILKDLIMKHMKINQLESLRTINKVCENIVKKLKMGYFKDKERGVLVSVSEYYLGDGQKNYWGYVELLVALEVFSLIYSMEAYEFLRGNNIDQLLAFISENEAASKRRYLEDLIATSYNYNSDDDTKLNYSDLDHVHKIDGLRRLFIPKNKEDGSGSISVFGSDAVF